MSTAHPVLLGNKLNKLSVGKEDQRAHRIAFVVEGSRGDCQPYCVLAAALQQQGNQVTFLTNEDLCEFAVSFGVDSKPCGHNTEEFMTNNEEFVESMKAGDFFKFIGALNGEEALQVYRDHVGNYWRELDTFQPDVMLCGPLTQALCLMYTFRRSVPHMICGLQTNLVTAHFAPFGLPSMPVWTGLNRQMWRLACAEFHKTFVAKQELTEDAVGEDMGWALDYQWWLDSCMKKAETDLAPAIFGTSVNFSKQAPDWAENATLTGWWTMDEGEQKRRSEGGSKHFGGAKHTELQDFISRGDAPVYMGWGSMTAKSKEHMSGMAVRALMKAKKRGIVLGGWAQVNLECLEQEADWLELKAYCDENVLFVTSAPHAWLFPRCACVVHHGGSGTTAASVKSGVPTIITPVFMDQWDYAKLVNEHEIGVATGALVDVSVDVLSAAIVRCCTDGTIRQNARNMAEIVRQEDGVGTATRIITTFVKTKVRTGVFRSEYEAQKAKYAPKKPVSYWSCCNTSDCGSI